MLGNDYGCIYCGLLFNSRTMANHVRWIHPVEQEPDVLDLDENHDNDEQYQEDGPQHFPQQQPEIPPEYYPGVIPPSILQYENSRETPSRQKASTLACIIDPKERTQTYYMRQRMMISIVFSPGCITFFETGDFGGFLKELADNDTQTLKDLAYTKFHDTIVSSSASERSGDSHLALIRFFNERPDLANLLPQTMATVKEWIHSRTRAVMSQPEVVQLNYPARWKIDRWPLSTPPVPPTLFFNDPIEILCFKLIYPPTWVDPWVTSTHYKPMLSADPNTGERIFGHFMSGSMAHDMEKIKDEMVAKQGTGWKSTDRLVPITYYEDGVSPSDHKMFSVNIVMMTCLFFPVEMLNKNWSTMCLGYINDEIMDLTEEQIVKNLMKYGDGFPSKESAINALASYKRSLQEVRVCVRVSKSPPPR